MPVRFGNEVPWCGTLSKSDYLFTFEGFELEPSRPYSSGESSDGTGDKLGMQTPAVVLVVRRRTGSLRSDRRASRSIYLTSLYSRF